MTMTSLTTDTTVGQFVVDHPARARVFQDLGIDFCCGGKLTLAEACQKKGLDAEATLAALMTPPASTSDPVDHLTMSELCDHIERTHHAGLRSELPRLGAMLRKVAAVHGSHHPWVHEMVAVFEPFAESLAAHMQKEEHVLFPWIRQIDATGEAFRGPFRISSPITMMEIEHEEAGQALARLRALSNGYTPPEGACNTFLAMLAGLHEIETDMHWHVHKENNILFPRALAAAGQ